MPNSEPPFGQKQPGPGLPQDGYSEAPGDARNRVAQAGNAAAHHVEPAQGVNKSSKSRQDADLAKLVAEENANRNKFPRYPGLERWVLLEKMGDGAFSNVYKARAIDDDKREVGIKVVRKYEMNNMQVCAKRD
jgi:serine/threonine-protein kinase RCK2